MGLKAVWDLFALDSSRTWLPDSLVLSSKTGFLDGFQGMLSNVTR